MKKALIVVGNISIGAQIAKIIRNNDFDVVVKQTENEHQSFDFPSKYVSVLPLPDMKKIVCYNKPKSKFHK